MTTEGKPNEKFDHVFSGLSVWLEPCPLESNPLTLKIRSLSQECGGPERGSHEFLPHCTLLYNINPSSLLGREKVSSSSEAKNSMSGIEMKSIGKEYLEDCVEKFCTKIGKMSESDSEGRNDCCSHSFVDMSPTEFKYFHYPKTADEGRGFGCIILLLALDMSPQLQILQNIVSSVFPPDERFSGEKNFTPHISLCYAPESETRLMDMMNLMAKDETSLLKPLRAKFLCVWNTQGHISDWRRIARVELP